MTDKTAAPEPRPSLEMHSEDRRQIAAMIAALTAAVSTPGAPYTDVSARLTMSPDGAAELDFRAYVKQLEAR